MSNIPNYSSDVSYIVEKLPTKSDVYEFIEQTDNLLNSIYSLKKPIEEKINATYSVEKKRILMDLIRRYSIDMSSSNNLETSLRVLCDTLRKIPVISLTLAIEPDDKLINRISSWIKGNASFPLIVDISRKKNVIAGAIIGLSGKYVDYTLKNMLKKSIQQPAIKK